MVTVRTRGRLPHWESDRAKYFVTFRLADSLPASVLKALELERENILATAAEMPAQPSRYKREKLLDLFDQTIDRHLDSGIGECHLARPEIARMVAQSLAHFDDQRYRIFAWCVMPNHVHVVFSPIGTNALAEIVHSWKSYSAGQANRMLGRSGPFWQREYYDHLVRDDADFDRVVQYVVENPAKAGLLDWPWVGRP